jgi:Protein of unknown function (DUF1524)
LARINRIGLTTAYPFLLSCYGAYARDQMPHGQFLAVLGTLENFMIRRFICNIPTNQLNKIFPPLYSQVQDRTSGSFVEGLQKILQTKDYPKDIQFKDRLADAPLYGGTDRVAKAKLILETIEGTYKHKEVVDFQKLTVEHIMPQTLTEVWKSHLGKDWEQTHELYLHSIGNLTLTGYNSELSNAPFEKKKNLLDESHLEINKYFRDETVWSRKQIEWRSYTLADILLGVWSYFGDDQSEPSEAVDVTGKTPDILQVLGQLIKVQSWSDVVVSTLNTISELEPDKFTKVVKRFPKHFEKEKLIRARPLENGLFVEANFSAKSAYRFCQLVTHHPRTLR